MSKSPKTPKLGKELRHPIWDELISPNITKLKKQRIKSIPRELRPDPLQFVITALVLLRNDVKTRVRVFNFIRRTAIAYDAYHSARNAYARFFRNEDHHSYLAALGQFEICLAAAYQGHEVLFGLMGYDFRAKTGGRRGELNWRMDRLYNKSKHTEGMIRAQSFTGDTVPMWISNDGLNTRQEKIRFEALYEIIFDMSLTASVMAKSHLWRKEMPPLLEKYSSEVVKFQRKRRRK